MGVEGEHSKPFVPGETGEGESKLEQPGPPAKAVSIREQTPKIRSQHLKVSEPRMTSSAQSKQRQPRHSSLHPRGKHLVVVPAPEAARKDEMGFLGDHPRAAQLQ